LSRLSLRRVGEKVSPKETYKSRLPLGEILYCHE